MVNFDLRFPVLAHLVKFTKILVKKKVWSRCRLSDCVEHHCVNLGNFILQTRDQPICNRNSQITQWGSFLARFGAENVRTSCEQILEGATPIKKKTLQMLTIKLGTGYKMATQISNNYFVPMRENLIFLIATSLGYPQTLQLSFWQVAQNFVIME